MRLLFLVTAFALVSWLGVSCGRSDQAGTPKTPTPPAESGGASNATREAEFEDILATFPLPATPPKMCVALWQGEPFDSVCDAVDFYSENCLGLLWEGPALAISSPTDCIAASNGNSTWYEACLRYFRTSSAESRRVCDHFFGYLCNSLSPDVRRDMAPCSVER